MTGTRSLELSMDGCIVYGDEAIHLQEMEQLVQKVDGVVFDEIPDIIWVLSFQLLRTTMPSGPMLDDITSFPPELENSIESMNREATAVEDVIKGNDIMFSEAYGGYFYIVSNMAHHCGYDEVPKMRNSAKYKHVISNQKNQLLPSILQTGVRCQ